MSATPQGNLHVALAMRLRKANPKVTPSWTNDQLLDEVDRLVKLAQTPRDGLFSLLPDEAVAS